MALDTSGMMSLYNSMIADLKSTLTDEYNSNRISSDEYASALVALSQQTMNMAVQAVQQQPLIDAQIAEINSRKLLTDAQELEVDARKLLINAQTTETNNKATLISNQAAEVLAATTRQNSESTARITDMAAKTKITNQKYIGRVQ